MTLRGEGKAFFFGKKKPKTFVWLSRTPAIIGFLIVVFEKRFGWFCFMASLALLGGAPPPTRAQLRAAEQARVALAAAHQAAQLRAAGLAADERLLGAELVTSATQLRALEQASADIADRVANLALRQAQARGALNRRAEALAPFMPMIQRLALYPTETLLAAPLPPEQAIRGILVLSGLTRQLEQDADALTHQQAALAVLGHELDQAVSTLSVRQLAQSAAAAALDARLVGTRTQRQAAEDDAGEQARRAAAEAARADGLKSAIARIEAEQEAAAAKQIASTKRTREASARPLTSTPQALPVPRTLAAPQTLAVPVAGGVLHGYGDAIEGGAATGITYQPPPSARVVSPCAGRTVYAGPFRSYGQLLIVDCGGAIHAVLSGFERLDTVVGRSVEAGEPVGVMPGWDPTAGGRRPALLLELRRSGQPINPGPLLQGKS